MQKFSELVYTRPDIAALADSIRDYTAALAKAKSFEETRDLFLSHTAKMSEFFTMYTIASVRNSVDTRDAFYEAEIEYLDGESPKLDLIMRDASEALLVSPFRAEMEAEFGTLYFKNLDIQKQFADERIVDDRVQESKLCQRYSKITANATIEFRGEEQNFYGLLKFMESTDRDTRREAFTAWAELYSRIAPELDAIYDEMVQLRHSMAQKLGFASYTEMSYLQSQRYDYNAEDVTRFRAQVKEIITPAVAKLREQQVKNLDIDKLRYYDEALTYPNGNPLPIGDKDELVAKAHKMYREMSAETAEFFDCMVENELFDLETRPGKMPGGYCTDLTAYNVPFIFSTFTGTSADVDVLTHEAGHAFESYTALRTQPISSTAFSTSEINEIHSMAMEHFAYPWMELFFGADADRYRYAHLAGALSVIPYMVCVDEFQHRVYADPNMTAAERRTVWHEIEREYMPWRDYDGNEFLEQGGFWMQKQHIFIYPFYYIEYALAQMGAFEFYGRSKVDRTEAWNAYLELCRKGGSIGYFDLLASAGLSNPFAEGTVKKIISSIVDDLKL